MIKLLVLLLPLITIANELFQTDKPSSFDTSAYETKKNEVNKEATKNSKISCRYVCDKKVYKEQKISEAIEFYKKSKDYGFNKD